MLKKGEMQILKNFHRTKLKKIIEFLEPRLPSQLIRIIEKTIGKHFRSHSFYGEDAILNGILRRYHFVSGKQLVLTYIDIGAWRPVKGSNTYFLYRKKQYGTAIEPNPYLKNIYMSVRPCDNYFEVGCHINKKVSLYRFNKSAASNSTDLFFTKTISKEQSIDIQDQIAIDCLTLDQIIILHLENYSRPFILDIDIEGSDYDVITSFSFFDHLRPCLIIIEDWSNINEKFQTSRITIHLEKYEYELVGRTLLTSIFIDKKSELFAVLKK